MILSLLFASENLNFQIKPSVSSPSTLDLNQILRLFSHCIPALYSAFICHNSILFFDVFTDGQTVSLKKVKFRFNFFFTSIDFTCFTFASLSVFKFQIFLFTFFFSILLSFFYLVFILLFFSLLIVYFLSAFLFIIFIAVAFMIWVIYHTSSWEMKAHKNKKL